MRQSPARAACDRARADRRSPPRSADGGRRARQSRAARRDVSARLSTSRCRNAAARSLIGLRIGSNTFGSASCVANSISCAKASTSVSASWLTKCNSSQSRSSSGCLSVVEHQPRELVVLAIEQRQRDDLVDRHDLGVAKRGGKQAAEVVERRLDSFPRRAAFVDDDRRGVATFAGCSTSSARWRRSPSPRWEAVRVRGGLAGDHLELHAALGAGLRIEHAGRDQLAAGGEFGRRVARRSPTGPARRGWRRRWLPPLGCLPNSRRIEAPIGRVDRGSWRSAFARDAFSASLPRPGRAASAEQRPAERRELPVECGIGRCLSPPAARAVSSFCTSGRPAFASRPRPGQLPLRQQRAGGDDRAGLAPALVGLGVEVPDALSCRSGRRADCRPVRRSTRRRRDPTSRPPSLVSFSSIAVRSQE